MIKKIIVEGMIPRLGANILAVKEMKRSAFETKPKADIYQICG